MDTGGYGFVLAAHSTLRWLILAAGIVATVRAWSGRLGRRSWTRTDSLAARVFVMGMDIQLVVGVLLYGVFSPVVAAAMSRAAIAMQNRGLRFWMVEHPLAMIVALALAHVGWLKAKRTTGPDAHRQASLYFTLAVLIVLASIPWPFFSYGRALLPSW